MPRSEARVFASIWDDGDDFIDLGPDAKLLYLFLISQPTLSHCGVITVTVQRWARKIRWDTGQLRDAMTELAKARYVVVDEMTEELLIRSLIRRDEVWKQPRMLRAALREAALVESPRLRAAITTELRRLDPSELKQARGEVTGILRDLPPRLTASADEPPPHPPPNGHREPPREPPHEAPAVAPRQARPEGQGGGGRGNGSSDWVAPFPGPLAPSPPRARAPAGPKPLFPFALPGAKAEEGGVCQDKPDQANDDIEALVRDVLGVRPDWSTASVRRALTDPRTLERPFPLVRAAVLAMAADRASKHPGRLPNDGDWWATARGLAGGTSPPPPDVTCPQHRITHAAAAECRSCAADRKAAS